MNDDTIEPECRPASSGSAIAFDDSSLEPIPPRSLGCCSRCVPWRRADAELAELLFDSASEELVGIRGGGSQRRSFRYGAGDVGHPGPSLRRDPDRDDRTSACRWCAGCERERCSASPSQYRTDELGELAVDAPELPARFEIELPSGTFVTPWITA